MFIVCFAVILIALSLCTILSEVTLFTHLPLSLFGLLISQSDNILVLNLLCLIPLIFLFFTALHGLFKLKLTGFYSMHKNRHTDSISLLFLAGFMCRVGFPLCINFIQILKLKKITTVLESTMGDADLVPVFGRNFIIFYPTILILLCVLNVFDFFGKFMNLLGFYSFGFHNAYNEEKIEDGRDVLMKSKLVQLFIFYLFILFSANQL